MRHSRRPTRSALICGALLVACARVSAQDLLVIAPNGTRIEDNDPPEHFRLTEFPSTPTNGSSGRTILLYNSSTTASLTLTLPLTITGNNPDAFDIIQPGSAVLAPFNRHDLLIGFSPSGPGVHTATINIGSDDPDTPSFQLNLKGSGYSLLAPFRPDLSVAFKKDPIAKFDKTTGDRMMKGKFEIRNLSVTALESGIAELYVATEPPLLFDAAADLLTTFPIGPIPGTPPGKKAKKVKVKFRDLDIGSPTFIPRAFVRVKPLTPADIDADYVDNQDFNSIGF